MKFLPDTLFLFLSLCLLSVNVNARLNPLDDYPSFQTVGSGDLTCAKPGLRSDLLGQAR